MAKPEPDMKIKITNEPAFRKPLRLWPGVVAVALQWLSRFGVKAVVPGFQAFGRGVMGALLCTLVIVVWWAFFSRAPRSERWGAIVLMPLALSGTWLIKHESMGLLWLIGYAVPVLCLAFVAWAVASRLLPEGLRLATMVATILLACGVWTLFRTEGINGDHVAMFGWRWAASPEERLLAEAGDEPAAPSPTAAPAVSGERPVAPAGATPAASPLASPVVDASKAPATRAAPGATIETRAEWPGFRGPRRDGIVSGVRIKTDWSGSPPVQLWRRQIGPGWSSFAVSGDLLYTQEQRGDDEIVSCYKLTTGLPVWRHRDAARFFESNAGAGPRATPALSNGRVYTFGATGILNALDARNGSVVWSRNTASDTKTKIPDWGFASSPLVVGDSVIVAAAGALAAYDVATGNPHWFGPTGGWGYSSPQLSTIDGVVQVLLLNGEGAISVAPADGKLLWKHAWKSDGIVQPAVIAGSDVLIGSGSGLDSEVGTRRIAVKRGPGGWTAEARWTSNGLKPYFNDFVVHKGHAFGFDGRILACIDFEDGKRKWKGGRYGNGQLVLLPDQDLLLVLTEEGELALVRATPDQFTELARFPAIEGKTWNHPALVGDVLLVRNGQEMAAFRLSLAGR